MVTAIETEEGKPENSTFSPEIQAAVRTELERILAAPSFVQSNRCKRFLSFVVLQTLSGHGSELKERTVGIGVFDRAIDYDTGEDSIVRVTSNEVRKRISQFYGESRTTHPIQIELARGSYVPEFRIHPTRRVTEALEAAAPENSNAVTPVEDTTSLGGAPPPSAHGVDETTGVQAEIAFTDAPGRTRSRKFLVSIALLPLLLVGGLTSVKVWKGRAENRIPQVWDVFQRSNQPVLICLGTHNLLASNAASLGTQKFSDLVLHQEIIPVDDVTAVASMASLLGKKGIPFRVVGATQASLTDLRRQPTILIGAADNKWTLRLTQNLRYRIEFVSPDQSQHPIASIWDTEQPAAALYKTDFSIPMDEWKHDYAIVARVDDPTTGVALLIDTGLGNVGSLAASEFIASDALTKGLANEPSCKGKSNFEMVIGTDIIDAKPGPPHILRLQCW